MNDTKNIQTGCVPSSVATQTAKVIITMETESQPWSINSPSGEALFVRRACLPSTASRDWYTKNPTAFKMYAHLGAYNIQRWYYTVV